LPIICIIGRSWGKRRVYGCLGFPSLPNDRRLLDFLSTYSHLSVNSPPIPWMQPWLVGFLEAILIDAFLF
jgi:hypothetical protein